MQRINTQAWKYEHFFLCNVQHFSRWNYTTSTHLEWLRPLSPVVWGGMGSRAGIQKLSPFGTSAYEDIIIVTGIQNFNQHSSSGASWFQAGRVRDQKEQWPSKLKPTVSLKRSQKRCLRGQMRLPEWHIPVSGGSAEYCLLCSPQAWRAPCNLSVPTESPCKQKWHTHS